MKRISKRVREEAAMLCAIAASTPNEQWWPNRIARTTGACKQAVSLAVCAWIDSDFYSENHYAEAEAMLRTGWSPE